MANERVSPLAEEDENFFVSMTDMMVRMLFIFIILLMAFALNFREAQETQQTINEASLGSRKDRDNILSSLSQILENQGVQVTIDHENGVMRLKADILFDKAKDELTEKGNEIIATEAEAVWVIVPCYSRIHEDTINRDCPKRTVTPLEAIFVEGHTDPDPFDPKFGKNNWTLSAQRAINTFKRMIATQPLLDELRNNSDQHLFGVSGYEARRRTQRLPGQTEKEWKAADRRIDLRFIMKSLTPEMVKELEKSVGRQ